MVGWLVNFLDNCFLSGTGLTAIHGYFACVYKYINKKGHFGM